MWRRRWLASSKFSVPVSYLHRVARRRGLRGMPLWSSRRFRRVQAARALVLVPRALEAARTARRHRGRSAERVLHARRATARARRRRASDAGSARAEQVAPPEGDPAHVTRGASAERTAARSHGRVDDAFPNKKGEQWNRHRFREQVWQPAIEAAGYQSLGFHQLRHTAISLMCRAGYRPEWVAERVGHADGGALILKRYRHLYPSESYAAAPSLDALLSSASR